MSAKRSPSRSPARTVQDYLDETPIWRDGTEIPCSLMTVMQWRIWWLAVAGKFFEGMVVFMTGVALPLIVREFGLAAWEKGLIGASPLLGILVGATTLGGLADRFGRKRMFVVEMVLFVIFLTLLSISGTFWLLVLSLFGTGVALGCDYPTAHMIISETVPTRMRGRLVLSAFGFQAVGALAGTGIGYLVLVGDPDLGAWRWMYATAIVPAVLVVIGRCFIPPSPHWLMERGDVQQARDALLQLLRRHPPYPRDIRLASPRKKRRDAKQTEGPSGYRALFSRRHFRATILAAVPWFLQDLGTYGIGIFTPTILASMLGEKTKHPHHLAALIHNDQLAARGAALLDLLLLAGIVGAFFLVDRLGRMRLQVFGFVGCAAGLFLASLSLASSGIEKMVLLFAGFMLFNFMTNLGPNAMTYLIAGEVFPTRIRGKGAGFAASFAKLGAVMTAFLFPILLKDLGTQLLLTVLVGTSLLGAWITWRFRIETRGLNLETLDRDSTNGYDGQSNRT